MKKKVGIITIMDESNYGNRLQNYAMEQFLEELGLDPYTIPNIMFPDWYYVLKNKREVIRQELYKIKALVWVVHKIKGKKTDLGENYDSKEVEARKNSFRRFNVSKLHMDNYIIKKQPIGSGLARRYDYFVVGSDQVWNPFYKYSKYVMYLRFAPQKKRIAISASFGMASIPEEYRSIIKRFLNGMQYISVRENSGRNIVKTYTGKTCDVLLDPTLLVSESVWENLIKNINFMLPTKFIAAYFLGELSGEKKGYIENLMIQYNCTVIWLNDKNFQEYYALDPVEFIYVLKNADFVITDSFHGCAISVLFKKQFIVFRREGYDYDIFDRIKTLLSMVGLTSQIKEECYEGFTEISDKQFEYVDEVLSVKRREAEDLLKEVFNLVEGPVG